MHLLPSSLGTGGAQNPLLSPDSPLTSVTAGLREATPRAAPSPQGSAASQRLLPPTATTKASPSPPEVIHSSRVARFRGYCPHPPHPRPPCGRPKFPRFDAPWSLWPALPLASSSPSSVNPSPSPHASDTAGAEPGMAQHPRRSHAKQATPRRPFLHLCPLPGLSSLAQTRPEPWTRLHQPLLCTRPQSVCRHNSWAGHAPHAPLHSAVSCHHPHSAGEPSREPFVRNLPTATVAVQAGVSPKPALSPPITRDKRQATQPTTHQSRSQLPLSGQGQDGPPEAPGLGPQHAGPAGSTSSPGLNPLSWL